MKKLSLLMALCFAVVSLNATVTKETIYETNPVQFDQLKKELSATFNQITEEQKQASINKQKAMAIKAVLSNKDILQNANYAVIKNGKILKIGKGREVDGISFWHEHSSALENPPAPYTCQVYQPSWENITLDSPCGMIKYSLSPNSPYAANTDKLLTPDIYILKPGTETSAIENIYSAGNTYYFDDLNNMTPFMIAKTHDFQEESERRSTFINFNEVSDIPMFAGYIYPELSALIKTIEPVYSYSDINTVNDYYEQTEYSYESEGTQKPIYTLKSGDYIHLMLNAYAVNDYWFQGFTIVLSWFNLRVENYYIGDVSIKDNDKNNLVQITWNNQEATINLQDSALANNPVYKVYNMSGKLIKKANINDATTKVNTSKLASGTYIIKVSGKDFATSEKIVVIK